MCSAVPGRSFDFNDPSIDTTALVDIVKGAQDEAAEAIGEIAGELDVAMPVL